MKLVVATAASLCQLLSCTPEEEIIDEGICPGLWVEVRVFVQKNGQPAILDSTYVIRKINGQNFVPVPGFNLQPGHYSVINDNYKTFTPDSLTIHGFLAGAKVLQETYYVDRTLCNIVKKSGRDTVVIQ